MSSSVNLIPEEDEDGYGIDWSEAYREYAEDYGDGFDGSEVCRENADEEFDGEKAEEDENDDGIDGSEVCRENADEGSDGMLQENAGEDNDDDEGIDWSEACRELDTVCETGISVCSYSKPSCFTGGEYCKDARLGNVDAKQTTLDRYIVQRSNLQPYALDDMECGEENPTGVKIDPDAAKTWLYPVNVDVPLRDYQFSITKTALFSNTLVVLPTGLGKTLIAAVVVYNFFRWFPDGKIVFTAPTRPLVTQQIEACHNIVGIPQEQTIHMTGNISPAKRADLWQSKRVFFVTPQVLEKDIEAGTCLVKDLVCLVIDEAHHAMGNYAYSVAVRKLMDVAIQLRILALTATPGSKKQTTQTLIDNLRISNLEYRDESDPDVRKYNNDRKIEVIKVALGQDANLINDKLSDVMRPYMNMLHDMRALGFKNDKRLSPDALLNSRDEFRKACPATSATAERYFGLLLTLCHVRKLLLSHGIRPAYEMLEDKFKSGYMSRNKDFIEAKLIMEKSLSHGVPSPKISKMLEVLIDHFKSKDEENSRVIIFSNFRGSVREIMDALNRLESIVRAAQFIGQSSGKKSKGQSQKAQQAVLEKFRSGVYNIIVSTSIGEEGLDIVEVDLVICFDSNVSPLRMIQRMGRTGRKNSGRVVVLACEGKELKGFTKNQESRKAMEKHMRNGGVKSFSFHLSPRMVPHIYKPEVQYVKFSIDKFIRSGKKAKDDEIPKTPMFKEKLTVTEKNLIAKYFHLPNGITWKPSLIAFPHFQTYPSRVHNVKHSYTTGLLIDTMQSLQGNSFAGKGPISLEKDVVCLEKVPGVHNIEPGKKREDNSEAKPGSVQDRLTIFTSPGNSAHCSDALDDEISRRLEIFPETPIRNVDSQSEDIVAETPEEKIKTLSLQQDEYNDIELSPRLTNMIKIGFVPESPTESNEVRKRENCDEPEPVSPVQLKNNRLSQSLIESKKGGRNNPDFDNSNEVQTPIFRKVGNASKRGCISPFVNADGSESPLVDLTNNSYSKNWCLSIEEKSGSVKCERKLKRLRKFGDLVRSKNLQIAEDSFAPVVKRACGKRGNKKPANKDIRAFIDEEAEVSNDGDMSEDEEDDQNNGSSDSFIDDRTCLTNSATQSTTRKPDMMAIYRRSLLTQSPKLSFPSSSGTPSPHSSGAVTATTGSPSGKQPLFLHSPPVNNARYSLTSNGSKPSSHTIHTFETVPCATTSPSKTEGRRRKLRFCASNYAPAINLEREFQQQCADDEMLIDDQFYEDIDFDAVEAQASLLLKQKSMAQKPEFINPQQPQIPRFDSPSFDLGI